MSAAAEPDNISGWQALDCLATGVIVLDAANKICFLNSAAEQLTATSVRSAVGTTLEGMFDSPTEIAAIVVQARQKAFARKRTDLRLRRKGQKPLDVIVTVIAEGGSDELLIVELLEIDLRMRAQREAHQLELGRQNSVLLRNLAHEVKNPLGGIRGAAQLLGAELVDPEQRECTDVIVKEADRLQALVDRLLEPHRHKPERAAVSLHEVCERVRAILLAEFPDGLEIVRDYDTSLPEVPGDISQLIQAVLNLARNAAQALQGIGRIDFVTRIARQVTVGRDRHKLALELLVVDNGPGIEVDLHEQIFLPLVSGRDGGSGLGLTLSQTYVQQHGGIIECDSFPGRTEFRVLLPLPESTR